MIRRLTVETLCFELSIASIVTGFSVWVFGMLRKLFGAIPAVLWLILTCVSLVCAAVVGVLEFTG